LKYNNLFARVKDFIIALENDLPALTFVGRACHPYTGQYTGHDADGDAEGCYYEQTKYNHAYVLSSALYGRLSRLMFMILALRVRLLCRRRRRLPVFPLT